MKAEVIAWQYYWAAYGIMLLLLIYRMLAMVRMIRKFAISLNAQILVGQELNELKRSGYSVYHDVELNSLRIDHLVVGESGVFLVTSLGHAKPSSKSNKQIRVSYQDGKLIFPTNSSKKDLEVIAKKVAILNGWLKRVVSRHLNVQPALIVPGWLVEKKEKPNIPILAIKQTKSFFSKLPNNIVSEAELDKINTGIMQSMC